MKRPLISDLVNVRSCRQGGLPCSWVSNVFHYRKIVADDLMRRGEEEGKDEPTKHENEECNICSIIDILESRVPVLSDGNSRSDDSAEIEDGPEISDISTLLFFDRI